MVIKTDRQDLGPEGLLVFQTFVSLVRVGFFPLEPNVSWSELKDFLLLQSGTL